jgi:hypothetical protein
LRSGVDVILGGFAALGSVPFPPWPRLMGVIPSDNSIDNSILDNSILTTQFLTDKISRRTDVYLKREYERVDRRNVCPICHFCRGIFPSCPLIFTEAPDRPTQRRRGVFLQGIAIDGHRLFQPPSAATLNVTRTRVRGDESCMVLRVDPQIYRQYGWIPSPVARMGSVTSVIHINGNC